MNRRSESQIRLETLGGLSDYYSDVASVSGRSDARRSINIDDSSQWEIDSVSSHASTIAVIFDKASPPGRSSRRTSEAARPTPSSGTPANSTSYPIERVEPKSDLLASKLNRARAESQSMSSDFNRLETQDKPARGLRRSRHPTVMRPDSTLPPKAVSEYGDAPSQSRRHPTIIRPGSTAVHSVGDDHGAQCPTPSERPMSTAPSKAMSDCGGEPPGKRTSYSSWQPEKPSYRPSLAGEGPQTAYRPLSSRPISTYSAYQPAAQVPSQSKPSSTTRRSSNLYGAPMRNESEDEHLRSNYSSATYSFAPRTANPVARRGVQSSRVSTLAERNNRRSSTAYSTAPEVVPPPTPRIEHVGGVDFEMISPEPAHGRRRSTAAVDAPPPPPPPPKREPSPSRGTWYPDPKQKRPSFVDRAQERIEKSLHMHAVKAGQRPLPSFQVNRVCRSPVEDVASWQSPTPPPPAPGVPFVMHWRQRMGQSTSDKANNAAELSASSPVTPYRPEQAQVPPYLGVYRALAQKKSDELFGIPYDPGRSGLFELGCTEPIQRASTPKLKIDTNAVPVELETPPQPSRDSYTQAQATPRPPQFPPSVENPTAARERSGSLFLEGKTLPSPASHSFFAPEWAQQQAQEQILFPPNAAPQRSTTGTNRPPLPREQLELAALPSGLDLGQPLDHRRRLPSQSRHQPQQQQQLKRQYMPTAAVGWVPGDRTLSRKKVNRSLR